jgi:hypothetical protein
MARPKKQTVDYFPHDTDASDSRVLTVLQNKYGNNGYAFLFKLKELLGRTPGHYYDFKDGDDWEFLLAKTNISDSEIVSRILNTLAILKAIDPELFKQGIIWSQEFVDSVELVYKKRNETKPERPNSVEKTPIPVTEMGVSDNENTQSKVKETIYSSKEGQHKAQSQEKKERENSVVTGIYAEMRSYLGFPDKLTQDPIPSYGKEGQAIKRMLTRGFTREAIVACWKSKVSQRGGEFVSMTWVNEDIGKPQKKQGVRRLPSEAEIAASIRKAKS